MNSYFSMNEYWKAVAMWLGLWHYALPISPQPVYLSLCRPAAARWPLYLPVSRNLRGPSLAGGSVAASCRWYPRQHTDTPGNEPPTPAACRGWDSRHRASNQLVLWRRRHSLYTVASHFKHRWSQYPDFPPWLPERTAAWTRWRRVIC